MSLLEVYLLAKRLRSKRQIIHRYCLFSEPIYNISLETILSKDKIKRTKENTDNSTKIENIKYLDQEQVKAFRTAWYFTMYDIKRSNSYNLYREVKIPKNAIKEIKNHSNNSVNIGISTNFDHMESIDKNKAISTLIKLDYWRQLLFYEFALLLYSQRKINRQIQKENIKSKKDIINYIYDNTKKAKYNTDIISDIVNASESYVKDIITGREEYGLSESERDDVLDRDNYTCQNCGSTNKLEVHHIIPISQGGNKDDNNLCTLCFECHINIAHGSSTSEVNYETISEFWDIIED